MDEKNLRILMVEDQQADAELLEYELRRGGLQFALQRVDTQAAFECALDEFKPTLILSDFSMPNFDGLSALLLARRHSPDTPFIFVSGTIGEDRAVEALQHGATDYVLKDRPKRILSAVSRALEEAEKRAVLRDSQECLRLSEERFRSFMQYLPARASIRDLDGRYQYVNEKWEQTFGLNAADVTGRLCYEARPAEQVADSMLLSQQVIATNKPVSRIFRARADGKWWFSTYFPIRDADSQKTALIGTVAIDITEQKLHEEKLNYLAYYDALTGLPNRVLFHERLTRELAGAQENRTALVVWNVNRFALINESLGYGAGDVLLREFACRLRSAWPDQEKVARLDADSFAGVISDVQADADIAHVVEKLAEAMFAAPFEINGQELSVSMTCGIAVAPGDSNDSDTLIRNAEAALKRAKHTSAHYAFYQPSMNASVNETLQLENKLRRALAHGLFDLHYQPKINLITGEIIGVEALMRMNDPELGLLSPVKFIPLLEETGRIIEVGQWAVGRALSDFEVWVGQGLRPPRIAVNVSSIQLAQDNFVGLIREIICARDASTHPLDLEITESVLMADIAGNIAKLKDIRDMGVKISIDDFGTGYSSLGYLARLPVHALKVDRWFVIHMTDDADNMAIVSTIISLAHSLGLKVIAEGVETEEQRRLLALLKCDELQGYLFSKPLTAQQLAELLQQKKA